MTVSENIVEGLGSDLRPGKKGASRAAIKSWLLTKGYLKDGPTANGAVKKAINKLMADGMLIAVTNHRFKVNMEKRDAEIKAKKDIIKKKKAVKAAKEKAAATAKKMKATAAKKKKVAAAKKKNVTKKKSKKVKKVSKKTKKAKKPTKKKAKKVMKKKAKK